MFNRRAFHPTGMALLAACVALIGRPDSSAHAATIKWTGQAFDNSWHSPGNWDLNRVPASGDEVMISQPPGGYVQFFSATTTVNSVYCDSDFLIFGGALELTGASAFNRVLWQAGGTITAAGTVTVTGQLIFDGGTMSGSGTTLANGGLLLRNQYGGANLAGGRTLVNSAGQTATSQGHITVGSGSTFRNDGTWAARDMSGTGSVVNNGTISLTLVQTTISPALHNYGSLTVDRADLTASGGFVQASGTFQVINAGGRLIGNTSLVGGTVRGPAYFMGHLNQTGGSIEPGLSPGLLTITGDYTLASGGTLSIEVGGTIPETQFGRIVVGGTASLAGTLDLELINGFQPNPNDVFAFLSAGTRTGTFGAVTPCEDTVTYASNGASVAFDRTPTVTDSPDPLTVETGEDAVFTIAATGSGSLTFQWRKNGINLTNGPTGNGSSVGGATSGTLTITSAQPADGGEYDCVVNAPCGSADADDATLEVDTGPGPRILLERSPSAACTGPGDTVTVQVRMADLGSQSVDGYQAFLSYDRTRLDYTGGGYTGTPFGEHLIDPIAVNEVTGEIDLAAGIDALNGQLPTNEDSLLATLTFTALSVDGNATIVFRSHDPPSLLSFDGDDIGAEKDGLVPVYIDATPPVLTLPDDVTIECTDPTDPAFTGSATATDDTDANPTVTYSDTETAGSCPQEETLTRRWRGEDCAGNVTEADQVIEVQDTTPPEVTAAAADQTVECDGAGNAAELNAWLMAHAGAEAEDNCGSVSWSHDFTALSDLCGATGAATVTFTATDECGNASVTSATFAVQDTAPPTIDVAAANQAVECDGAGNTTELSAWLSSHAGASASDTCGGVTWTNDFTALSDLCGATGAAAVTFTATDECGNASTTTATFTIEDTTAPVVTPPADISVDSDAGGCTAALVVGLGTAEDDCDGGPITVTGTRGDALPLGDPYPGGATTTITWSATDACGNTGTPQQLVAVSNENVVKVDGVQLDGVSQASLTRCITFELIDCEGSTVTREQEVLFTSGLCGPLTLRVPCGAYECISARDRKHTLKRVDTDDFAIEAAVYVASFMDAGGDNDALQGGNLNDSAYIDILDFSIFVARWNTNYGTGSTSCSVSGRHADISGNGVVFTEDFTFIQIGFLAAADGSCCLGPGEGGEDDGPIVDISTEELIEMGEGELVVADLTGDGRVNAEDVAAFMSGERPKKKPKQEDGDSSAPVPPKSAGRHRP